jgi:hypothetical protein
MKTYFSSSSFSMISGTNGYRYSTGDQAFLKIWLRKKCLGNTYNDFNPDKIYAFTILTLEQRKDETTIILSPDILNV